MEGLQSLFFLGLIYLYMGCESSAQQVHDDSSKPTCVGISDGIFLPDYTNCKKYYVCFEGKSIPGICPGEYVFDVNLQMCNIKDQVKCFTCPPKTLKVFKMPGSCSRYVLCFNSEPIMRNCLDGLQYNHKTDRCDFAKNVDCINCPVDDQKNKLIFFGSHAQCDKYYLCSNGQPEVLSCTKGLHFNPNVNECDLPERANCRIREDNPNTKLGAGPVAVSRFDALSMSQSFTIECPKSETHFYPDLNNERQYFLCVNGNSTILSCENNLIYDQSTRSCRLNNIKKQEI